MNQQSKIEEIPIGYRAAYEAMIKKNDGRRNFRNLTYRLPAVVSLHVEDRYESCQVRNPRHTGLRKLWEPEYISGSRKGLSYLWVDGEKQGLLHGGSDGAAVSIQQMLANSQNPVDLIISGHFTESGWYIDSVKVDKTKLKTGDEDQVEEKN